MNTDIIQSLTTTFEDHAQQTETGVEYWLARDLQHLLGYAEWRNFNQTAISKAKTACEMSGFAVTDHFVDVNKTIQMPKNAPKVPNPSAQGNALGYGRRKVTSPNGAKLLPRQNLPPHELIPCRNPSPAS